MHHHIWSGPRSIPHIGAQHHHNRSSPACPGLGAELQQPCAAQPQEGLTCPKDPKTPAAPATALCWLLGLGAGLLLLCPSTQGSCVQRGKASPDAQTLTEGGHRPGIPSNLVPGAGASLSPTPVTQLEPIPWSCVMKQIV